MSVGGGTASYPVGKNGAPADTNRATMETRNLERTGVLLAGSVAAGVHAALAPAHLGEWLPLGVAFLAAAAAASLAVAALALRPADRRTLVGLGVLLAALVAGYLTTRLTALPPLDPEREPLDGLGLTTTAVEAAGVLLAVHLSRSPGGTR